MEEHPADRACRWTMSPVGRAITATVALLGATMFVVDVIAVKSGASTAFDRHVQVAIQDDLGFGAHLPMSLLTLAGSGAGIAVLVLILTVFFLSRTVTASVVMTVAQAGDYLIEILIKHLVPRQAPHVMQHAATLDTSSFPSGHAMGACSLAYTVTYIVWKIWGRVAGVITAVASAPFALGVGLSRIYLDVHWPTDILGAYCLSLCWVALLVLLLDAAFAWMP